MTAVPLDAEMTFTLRGVVTLRIASERTALGWSGTVTRKEVPSKWNNREEKVLLTDYSTIMVGTV